MNLMIWAMRHFRLQVSGCWLFIKQAEEHMASVLRRTLVLRNIEEQVNSE